MTQDEIIRMAIDAGLGEYLHLDGWRFTPDGDDIKSLERFYELAYATGAAHEREKLAEHEPVVDLSKVNHEDKCRYFDDERFCDCGADLYELLKWYRNKPVRTKDLTDEDKLALWKKWNMTAAQIDAVIAAYKEKNRG